MTTAWLILLTWPLYLLAIVFGPSVLAIFGRSYHAGSTVMIILAFAMLVATGCGQVDMVLITTGRSSWSLVNGLLAMAINIGVDLALIPRLGITGAAIGWAAAIAITNLVPLVQVAAAERVHPFGRGMAAACALSRRELRRDPAGTADDAGPTPAVSIGAMALGCAVMALGLWRLHGPLHLSAMPGFGRFARIAAAEPDIAWRCRHLPEHDSRSATKRYRPQEREGFVGNEQVPGSPDLAGRHGADPRYRRPDQPQGTGRAGLDAASRHRPAPQPQACG